MSRNLPPYESFHTGIDDELATFRRRKASGQSQRWRRISQDTKEARPGSAGWQRGEDYLLSEGVETSYLDLCLVSEPIPVNYRNNHSEHRTRGDYERLEWLSKKQLDSDILSFDLLRYACQNAELKFDLKPPPVVDWQHLGLLIILSKFSDIVGRKPIILLNVFLFMVFSAACGAARSFEQLAILRAFQGIGGGGIYTLVFVISLQMVPPERFPALSAIFSAALACSVILGPILGGLISDQTTWRWVFLMNVPPGLIVLILICIALPASFPYQSSPSQGLLTSSNMMAVRRVDFVGAFLLLGASILFVSALEEGGTEYPWRSTVVLSLFCISIVLWVLFFAWENVVIGRFNTYEPVLPWRLITNRMTLGFLLNALFGGAIFIASVIVIPQRFQVVNDLSAFGSGWRLLALMLCCPLGAVLTSMLVTKVKIPSVYIFLFAAILQIIGLALMGTLSVSNSGVPSAQYGYQVILGLGIGTTLTLVIVAAPTVIEDKDTAVFVGALAQARMLGGSIGLAVCTNILNEKVKSASDFLTRQQLNDLLESAETIKTLPTVHQEDVRQIFGRGYNEQMQALTAFGGCAVLATLMMWEKQQRRMK